MRVTQESLRVAPGEVMGVSGGFTEPLIILFSADFRFLPGNHFRTQTSRLDEKVTFSSGHKSPKRAKVPRQPSRTGSARCGGSCQFGLE